MSWAKPGTVGAIYTLDGSPIFQVTAVTQSKYQFTGNYSDQANYLLYAFDFLQSGNHTLVVDVSVVRDSQAFIFDYLTYTPTFSSLATMPNLTGFSATSTATGSSETAGATGAHSSSKSSSLAGAIAEGVIGGIILLSAVAAFCFWYGRRSASQKTAQSTALPTNYASEPLAANMRQQTPGHTSSPSNGNTISPFLDAGVTQYGLASYVPTPAVRKQGLRSERYSATTSGDHAMSDAASGDDLGSLARGEPADPTVGNVLPPSYDNIPGNSHAEYQQPLVPLRKSSRDDTFIL